MKIRPLQHPQKHAGPDHSIGPPALHPSNDAPRYERVTVYCPHAVNWIVTFIV